MTLNSMLAGPLSGYTCLILCSMQSSAGRPATQTYWTPSPSTMFTGSVTSCDDLKNHPTNVILNSSTCPLQTGNNPHSQPCTSSARLFSRLIWCRRLLQCSWQETCGLDAIMAQDLAAATVAAAIQKWNFYKQFFKAMFLKMFLLKRKTRD